MRTLVSVFAADFVGTPAWGWLTFIGLAVALPARIRASGSAHWPWFSTPA